MSANTRTYSKRLGSISNQQLQQALDRFDLGRLVRAEPVQHGFSGQNVFLTSTTGEWVLRGAPHDEAQLARERFFVDQLHERTSVSVPWPYLVEESAGIFEWGFAIMPRLPGLQLADTAVRAELGLESRMDIARELGRALHQMQQLSWAHAGEYDGASGTIAPLPTDHSAWIRARTELLLERMPGLVDDDRAWGRELLDGAQAALEVPFARCFVMLDYHENNILASPVTGGGWELGVVDFASSYFGDGERDLVRGSAAYAEDNSELSRAFVQSYVDQTTLRPHYANRFRGYMLLERLSTWGFAWRYGKWWDDGMSFRDWAQRFVSLDVF